MQPAEILIAMFRDGAIIARNPTLGTFLLKASAAARFISAPIRGLDNRHFIDWDLNSAASPARDGLEIYLLPAEGRRYARNISREVERESAVAIAPPVPTLVGS